MSDRAQNQKRGVLYVIATPIGNLGDMSARGLELLSELDKVFAEDTRHSQRLLTHFGLHATLISLHDHNEDQRLSLIAKLLDEGENLGLISDAGTPLISDPGYKVVSFLRSKDYQVIPIPGPSALITALSVSGLGTRTFSFEGFLPVKAGQKKQKLVELSRCTGTVIFYESSHRILDTMRVMDEVMPDRNIFLAREMTKKHESYHLGLPNTHLERMELDSYSIKGEFVLAVEGAADLPSEEDMVDADTWLKAIVEAGVETKTAALIAKQVTGQPKRMLYQRALELSSK